ncbi:TPA: hypothetical protein JG832_002449 [Enterobacter hormaechei subsp. xiangfangensis]|nr:hypothetical protein [Enterobacter hormaechei subsp. xiangfangensis]HAV1890585.1 hypothetical protein [Enterobacter hormaechei subsp. xiangfangensis]
MATNMLDLLQTENFEHPTEKEYSEWLKELGMILGDVNPDGIEFDLWKDGCTPDEAAAEIMARENNV